MFSPEIVCSEEFLDMPPTSRDLYFQLGMRADDDGFIQPNNVMRMLGITKDDLKILLSKRFLLPFQSGVVVVKHWLIHNMIRADRYKPTRFVDEKKSLFIKDNKAYTDNPDNGIPLMATKWQPNGNLSAPQVRLGKVNTTSEQSSPVVEVSDEPTPTRVRQDTSYRAVFDLFGKYPPNWKTNRTEIQAAKNILEQYGLERAKLALAFRDKYKDDPYFPQILKPSDLDRKWVNLQAYRDKV